MNKSFLMICALAMLSTACVNLPHSAHPLAANAMEKPVAPEDEELKLMIPLSGGLAFYDIDPPFAEDATMLNDVNLQSYFGEAGISFSKSLSKKSGTAFSGGLSMFSYSGRSIGPEESEQFGMNRRQSYSGYGGRINLSIDLNYEMSRKSNLCWRVFNVQHTFAAESGTYGDYRQIAIDSSYTYFLDPFDNELRATPAASNFMSTHFYSELILDYETYGFTFGLGFLNHLYQTDLGVWESYIFNGTMHVGFNIRDFYARFNFGSLTSIYPFADPFNMNMLVGYRVQLL